MIRTTVAVVLLFGGLASEAMAGPPAYTLLEITRPSSQGTAYALNESGDVVGAARFGDADVHAFLYRSATGVLSDLGTLGGPTSVALDINEVGSVTGWASKTPIGNRDPEIVPFLFQSGSLQEIDLTPIGRSAGVGLAISDSGLVVGSAHSVPNNQGNAGFLIGGSHVVSLGDLGGHSSAAGDINLSGTIVGSSVTPDGHTHAFSFFGGVMQDLGSFGGQFDYSGAAAINEFGLIVGESTDATTNRLRAVAFVNGALLNLGTLAGFDTNLGSSSLAVNNHGDIVGRSGVPGVPLGMGHGFLYFDGTMYDLNTLVVDTRGLIIDEAWDINDKRQIVGRARVADGTVRAVLLTPIPEPTTLALFGAGLVVIATVVRRRQSACTPPRTAHEPSSV